MAKKTIKVEQDGSIIIPLEYLWRNVKDELPAVTESDEPAIPDCKWSKKVLIPHRGEVKFGMYEVTGAGNPSGTYKKWFLYDELEEVEVEWWMPVPEIIKQEVSDDEDSSSSE